MPDQKTVFITYRRPVSNYIASAVSQSFMPHRYDVFMDIDITDTVEFDEVILRQVEARAHFIPVLTPGDLALYANPKDWKRLNIEHAIRSGRNIVSLLVNGFDFQEAAPYFTGELAKLAEYPTVTVPVEYFQAAMDRLRTQYLETAPEIPVVPVPKKDESLVRITTRKIAKIQFVTDKQLQAESHFQRAYHRARHDHETKIADFTAALAIYPDYMLAYMERGVSKRILGDFVGSIEDTTAAIKLDTKNAELYTQRGIAYFLNGDGDKANADYAESLRLHPGSAETYINRADARRSDKEFAGALEDLTAALACSPLTPEAYLEFCTKHNRKPLRNVDDQLALFRRYRFIALTQRAEIRLLQEDINGAIVDYTDAIALQPEDITAYTARASAKMQLHDMAGAVADLSEAMRLDGNNDALYHQRGFAYHELQNHAAALADYDIALTLNPKSVLTYCNRAEIYLEHQDYASALHDFNLAHEQRPGHPLILAGLALAHFGMGNSELATETWGLLANADARFKDAEAVGKWFNWKAPVVAKVAELLRLTQG